MLIFTWLFWILNHSLFFFSLDMRLKKKRGLLLSIVHGARKKTLAFVSQASQTGSRQLLAGNGPARGVGSPAGISTGRSVPTTETLKGLDFHQWTWVQLLRLLQIKGFLSSQALPCLTGGRGWISDSEQLLSCIFRFFYVFRSLLLSIPALLEETLAHSCAHGVILCSLLCCSFYLL